MLFKLNGWHSQTHNQGGVLYPRQVPELPPSKVTKNKKDDALAHSSWLKPVKRRYDSFTYILPSDRPMLCCNLATHLCPLCTRFYRSTKLSSCTSYIIGQQQQQRCLSACIVTS
jgi:hypothetical protein